MSAARPNGGWHRTPAAAATPTPFTCCSMSVQVLLWCCKRTAAPGLGRSAAAGCRPPPPQQGAAAGSSATDCRAPNRTCCQLTGVVKSETATAGSASSGSCVDGGPPPTRPSGHSGADRRRPTHVHHPQHAWLHRAAESELHAATAAAARPCCMPPQGGSCSVRGGRRRARPGAPGSTAALLLQQATPL